ncbi:MAG: hypothetical protein AAF725_02145 [Acidobacteriota bacterium]
MKPSRCYGLSPACRGPRPQGGGAARCDSPECREYAALIEALGEPQPAAESGAPLEPRGLPAGLAARLAAMPEDLERADSLYVSALSGDPLGDRVPLGEERNPGRRAAHDALAVTFAEARRRRPLPHALETRLRAIPKRRAAEQLPRWVTDSRWATAACLLLTAALGLAAQDASARFAQTTAWVQEAPARIQETSRLAGGETFTQAEEGLRQASGDLERRWSAWTDSANREWRRAQRAADAAGQDLREEASENYEAAADRLRNALKTLENSELARLGSELFQPGDDDE